MSIGQWIREFTRIERAFRCAEPGSLIEVPVECFMEIVAWLNDR